MKKVLAIILALSMVLSLAACGSKDPAASTPAAGGTKDVVWATASLGGTIQMVATAIATVVNKYESDLKITIQATGGSVENVRLFRGNEADIIHTTEAVNGFRGTGSFQGEEPLTKLQTLFKAYGNETVALVLDGSPLTDTYQLEGKKVCIGPTGSGISQQATAYLKAIGLYDKCDVLNISYNDSVDALKDGTIDVLFAFTSGQMPNSYLTQLQTTAKVRALPLDTSVFEAIFKDCPDFAAAVLPVGSLDCITEEYKTFASYSIEYVDSRMSEDVAYRIVKNIYEHGDELTVYNKSCSALKLENAMDGMPLEIPVHPGAAKYFKEKGVWNDAYKVGSCDN